MLHMGVKPDVSRAARNLSTIGPKLARAIERRGLRQGAKILQRHAKDAAPVETGRLKRSIKVRSGRRSRLRQTVNVVVGVPYAKKIEELYGFLSIAADDADQQVRAAVQDAVRSELARS